MDKKFESIALVEFKEGIDEIFDSAIALGFYRIIRGALMASSKTIGLAENDNQLVFDPVKKFEKKNYLHNALYVNLVAILETYLQDRLLEELKSNGIKIEKLIKAYDIQRKLTPQDVIYGPSKLAEEIVDGVVYHKLKLVNILYKIVFEIDIINLLKDKEIWKIIEVRHKIVHRSGRVNDKRIFVGELGLLSAMTTVNTWVESIDYLIKHGKVKEKFPNYTSRYSKKHSQLDKSTAFGISRKVLDKEFAEAFPSIDEYIEDKHILVL